MRAAKDAGRAQHRFFDEALNAQAMERLLLETELREAIDAGELRLHYQPKVDARTGRIVGAEALVRWQHPVRGLVPPDHFIGLAEECGLIVPLTDWVLDSACRSLRQWSDAGLRTVPIPRPEGKTAGRTKWPPRSSSRSALMQPAVCARPRASTKPKWPHAA